MVQTTAYQARAKNRIRVCRRMTSLMPIGPKSASIDRHPCQTVRILVPMVQTTAYQTRAVHQMRIYRRMTSLMPIGPKSTRLVSLPCKMIRILIPIRKATGDQATILWARAVYTPASRARWPDLRSSCKQYMSHPLDRYRVLWPMGKSRHRWRLDITIYIQLCRQRQTCIINLTPFTSQFSCLHPRSIRRRQTQTLVI